MKTFLFGRSSKNLPIFGYRFDSRFDSIDSAGSIKSTHSAGSTDSTGSKSTNSDSTKSTGSTGSIKSTDGSINSDSIDSDSINSDSIDSDSTGSNSTNTNEEAKSVLLLGGVHGDEVEGVILARGLINKLMDKPIKHLNVTVVPEFNIEGVLLNTRQNYAGVDLNRNLPTKDWSDGFTKIRYYPGSKPCSEPENKNLNHFLETESVNYIISLHSWKPMLNVNGNCSPISDYIAKKTNYIIKDDIGYPTPGSLGTYTGLEKGIPTLTYELQKGIDFEEILGVHLNPLYEALDLYSKTTKKD